jgi:histidine triad (HIT) family protein
MPACLFCKIANGEIESEIAYTDDQVVAFEDVNPQAPVHTLVIPKKHISTVNDLNESDNELMGHMLSIGKKLAKEKGISDKGYRMILNTNREAGQSVFHIHLHLMGGRPMGWPPG